MMMLVDQCMFVIFAHVYALLSEQWDGQEDVTYVSIMKINAVGKEEILN